MQIRKNYLPPLCADYTPPSDKSISHRGIFFSSISSNEVKISNFLLCDDCLRTIDAFRELGVEIRVLEEKAEVHVKGVGLRGLKRPQRHLYLGNSGTTARLLLGLLSAQEFDAVIEGDESLSRRPMRRVTEPLSLMGAKFEGRNGANYLPIKVKVGS
jgi:3-phosphoshikimate 1-carboxyvinyltransferase